ncbi:DUF3857 domain-containing protein [Prolixibacteraceae bacterium JC049]|nr:DUF3857 domain-containing protein [Prolixibacteraceae bacterium JC049]
MKTLTFLLLLFIFSIPLYAQTTTHKFGRLNPSDISLTKYSKFPDADAIVLFDLGKSRFVLTDNGFDIHFTRHRRVKILNQAGIKHANFEIPFYNSKDGEVELVTNVKVLTYNIEDNTVKQTALDRKQFFKERINKNWQVLKFAAPNVRMGSVIDIYYQIETPFIFNLPDWEFQCSIPTILSQYKVGMIPFYSYVFVAKGLSKFDIYHEKKSIGERTFATISFKDMQYTYGMKDIPEFKDESFISTREDYLMKIDFQLAKIISPEGVTRPIMTTWKSLSKDLMKHQHFGRYIKRAKSMSSKILTTDIAQQNDQKKLESIVQFIKDKFSWNGTSSKYVTKNLKTLLKQKEGNSAELNLLLIGLLQSAKIDAKPVLISTRSHGKIYEDYPFEHFLNYPLVMVNMNNKVILLDATEKKLPYTSLPPRCLNDKGLVINTSKEQWIQIAEENTSNTISKIKIENIDANSHKATVQLSRITTGLDALSFRNKVSDSDSAIKYFKEAFSTIEKTHIKNQNKYKAPFIVSCKGIIEPECIQDKIILKPFLNLFSTSSPFTQRERTYPIDFTYKRAQKFESVIVIPDGYKVIAKPKPIKWNNEAIFVQANSSSTNNKLNVSIEYQFKKSIYPPKDYKSIKFYWNNIIKAINEQIILQKQ